MGKPRLIILIRHAQSEGNKNREIHQTIPDHRVKLTNDGWQQAYDAGHRLRKLLRADDTLHFFTSPYRRTRETTEGILETLTSDDTDEGPSPFKRNNIKVYEEPRLREQDFGNFQPCSAEMERMWQERADYGHFFYRIPDGESAADAYDRVSGFNESLWRQFGEDDFASVCVLVTHGLMSRVFLMKWYHFSVEYFEDLRNVNHCEFLIMRKETENGKYILENKLRTWSALRRERAALLKQKEEEAAANGHANGSANGGAKDASKLERAAAVASPSSSIVPPRRWGGCPNGCNHDKNFRIRSGLADLVKRDGVNVYDSSTKTGSPTVGTPTSATATGSGSSLSLRRPAARRFHSSTTTINATGNDSPDAGPLADGVNPPAIDITKAQEELVSSPDATPSFITVDDRLRSQLKSPPGMPPAPHHPRTLLHLGRDFGGSYSGHTSDADSSEDDTHRRRMSRLRISTPSTGTSLSSANGAGNGSAHGNGHANGNGNGKPKANRLGDAPHCSDCERSDEQAGDDEHEHECSDEPGGERVRRGAKKDQMDGASPGAMSPVVHRGPDADGDRFGEEEQEDEVDEELSRMEAEERGVRSQVY